MRRTFAIIFFILGAGLGITELVALQDRTEGNTASELVWSLPWWARLLVAAFCAWLAVHFGLKALPGPKSTKDLPAAWRIVCDAGNIPEGQGTYPTQQAAQDVLRLHSGPCPGPHHIEPV